MLQTSGHLYWDGLMSAALALDSLVEAAATAPAPERSPKPAKKAGGKEVGSLAQKSGTRLDRLKALRER